jgi:hypothetical protein
MIGTRWTGALRWLPYTSGGDVAAAINRNPGGDAYYIDLKPDDEGFYYLRINDGDCHEGDWRKSVQALKRLANTYAKRNA